jgi:hypothetical protein
VSWLASPDLSEWGRSSTRRRATAIGLTLAAELLFLWILLGLNPPLPNSILSQPIAVTFDLAPKPQKTPAASPRAKAKVIAQSPPKQTQPRPVAPQPKPAQVPPSPFIAMNKSDMAAADISKLGSGSSSGSGEGANSAVAGPGEGPGGVRLYKAEWYREPTDGELAYYLPKNGVDRGSWAQIACQTVEHYHVDNCSLLGESPMGSGLARAIRLASWQFLVRPPRIDGKPLVGSWVRIRIEFGELREE